MVMRTWILTKGVFCCCQYLWNWMRLALIPKPQHLLGVGSQQKHDLATKTEARTWVDQIRLVSMPWFRGASVSPELSWNRFCLGLSHWGMPASCIFWAGHMSRCGPLLIYHGSQVFFFCENRFFHFEALLEGQNNPYSRQIRQVHRGRDARAWLQHCNRGRNGTGHGRNAACSITLQVEFVFFFFIWGSNLSFYSLSLLNGWSILTRVTMEVLQSKVMMFSNQIAEIVPRWLEENQKYILRSEQATHLTFDW